MEQRAGSSGALQTRTFVYDSLKRLNSATNPESGTICYGTVVSGQCQPNGYDANGNLVYKTDARGVLTSFEPYDALNRPITKHYSDGTPIVSYNYDTASNGKGRLASVSSSVSSYSYSGYDALGRVLSAAQVLGSQTYSMSFSYDLAGHEKTMAYPSGHAVSYYYDAAGRPGDLDALHPAFGGNLGDGTTRTYSSVAGTTTYDAASRLRQEKFGTSTAIYNKLFYNVRGQLAEIREGTTANDTWWNRGAIINHYSNNYGCWGASCNAADNNGNLMKQDIYIPGDDQISSYVLRGQQYSYDSLNRLKQVHEDTGVPSYNWQQAYNYDRWGNRTLDQANTSNVGIPTWNFGVDTSTNRLTPPGGWTMSYDNAGNLTNDNYTGQGPRTYDGENRMITANNGADVYTYDGEGHRVKRNISGSESWQVYGVGDELIAEYMVNGSPSSPQKEYGYRNGQLMITTTVTAGGWGAAPGFTGPDPLVTGNDIKLENLTELRTAMNQLRAHAGLAAYSFTVDPAPERNVTTVKADHIRQLRAALEEARSHLGLSTGGYAHPTLYENSSLIYAIDFQELRDQIRNAWNSGTGGVDLRWLVGDQLGTPRMVFDQSGNLSTVSRHDYLPFGEELVGGPLSQPGTGGRVTTQGYTTDSVRQKFTLKERDNETGLDYFGYRYFASTQGRWTSVDPLIDFERNLGEPQAWNLYQYCVNNPLTRTDPDGRQDSIRLNGTHAIEQELRKAGYNEQQIKVFMEEYRKGQTRALNISVTTLAGLTIAPALRQVGTVILTWMGRNPDTVNQLGQEALQMSTGSPAPASVPRLNPEAIEQFGTSIAKDVSGLSRGQMGGIATRVSECGLNQADAVGVVQTAIQKVGKSSIAVPQANGSVVVASVQAGINKPILIVNQQGVVSQARATINAGIRKGKAFFEVTNIK